MIMSLKDFLLNVLWNKYFLYVIDTIASMVSMLWFNNARNIGFLMIGINIVGGDFRPVEKIDRG